MGDAEIIPIGTRGRPGRGTGSAQAVLGRPRPGRPARPAPAKRATRRRGRRQPRAAARARRRRKAPAETAAGRRPSRGRRRAPARDGRATARPAPRHPGRRLARGAPARPPRRSSASSWEPRLAQFLAFLRRRVTGDYEVDEFGFDPEVTERFLHGRAAADRRRSGSGSRSAAPRTSPPRAARWSSPTTPARSRSTG